MLIDLHCTVWTYFLRFNLNQDTVNIVQIERSGYLCIKNSGVEVVIEHWKTNMVDTCHN